MLPSDIDNAFSTTSGIKKSELHKRRRYFKKRYLSSWSKTQNLKSKLQDYSDRKILNQTLVKRVLILSVGALTVCTSYLFQAISSNGFSSGAVASSMGMATSLIMGVGVFGETELWNKHRQRKDIALTQRELQKQEVGLRDYGPDIFLQDGVLALTYTLLYHADSKKGKRSKTIENIPKYFSKIFELSGSSQDLLQDPLYQIKLFEGLDWADKFLTALRGVVPGARERFLLTTNLQLLATDRALLKAKCEVINFDGELTAGDEINIEQLEALYLADALDPEAVENTQAVTEELRTSPNGKQYLCYRKTELKPPQHDFVPFPLGIIPK